ncbi:hypothetical protein Dimus_037398, partial [Dionaea muscipula]
MSSGSSTLSPMTAVLLCQEAIAASGHADGNSKLTRSDSVSSVSSPSVGCCYSVCDGVRQMKVDGDGGQGGAALPMASVSLPCSSIPECRAPPICGPMVVGEGLEDADGSVVLENLRAGPLFPYGDRPVAGCGGAQSIIDAGEVLIPSVVFDDVQCLRFDKGSNTLDAANVGGGVRQEVYTKLNPLRMCDPLLVGSNMHVAVGPLCDSSYPLLGGSVGRFGDGSVSKEGRVSSVARESLSPQPADGLRQPPSSPVDPVIGAEGGGGQDGRCGGRSYAHVVQVDRRVDVELSYLPPVDGGNTIIMKESDGDTLQWGSCLVGHFLLGSLPF